LGHLPTSTFRIMSTSNSPSYSHSRLSCTAGYYDLPNINSAMIFNLKQFPCLSARIVKVGNWTFELWSLNLRQLPFLLGERLTEPATRAPLDVSQRRYDGHMGKHDCIYSLQYFLEATSHWPFIRRVVSVPVTDPAYAAFQPLTEGQSRSPRNTSKGVWEPDFIQGLKGVRALQEICLHRLQSGFHVGSTTWASQPAYCSEARLQSLLGV
jgi:hypothetical protein